MATVSDILVVKGTTVHSIKRDATVYEAIEKMVRNNVGALVVVDDDVPCGVITERDYMRRVALEGRSSRTTAVEEIMSSKVVCVMPTTSIERCMAIMTERRVRHLPVLNEGSICGIVSIGDVVKWLADTRADEIEHLTQYIQGRA